MQKIRGIAFDWDGTIVDSMPSLANGIQETAASYGIHVSVQEILDNYFQPREAYYESIGIDTSDRNELNRRHSAAIRKYPSCVLFPEAGEILRFLHEKNLELAIASNNEPDYLRQSLKQAGLEKLFRDDMVLGGIMPKEEKLSGLLENLALPGDSILYVGDLPSDILAAKAAGVRSAGVARREFDRRRLASLNPDYLLASLEELRFLAE